MRHVIALFVALITVACGNKFTDTKVVNNLSTTSGNNIAGSPSESHAGQEPADTTFVNLRDFSQDFIFDMKYATTDNFLKQKVYDCDECYLRLKTIRALVRASEEFGRQGLRIKILDCYRPVDVQKKMWRIVSNPKYVADPAKGSIHNRGGAVDITLVDGKGLELEMGTGFDHFGPEAGHGFKNIPAAAVSNRKLLRKIMEDNGFNAFESEWWHYNLTGSAKDQVSNFTWSCD